MLIARFLLSLMFFSCLFTGRSQSNAAEGSVYEFALTSIGGKPLDLASFKGKVLLIVNTASHCGFTKQFTGLEKIYKEEQTKGLVVIGVPSNSFKQELADETAVGDFCKRNYGVTFPMSKISVVTGEKTHPLFRYLVAHAPKDESGEVQWNFEKFLIDRKGQVAARYRSATSPDDAGFKARLAGLLAEKS